jgi:serine/threonine-protein kinase
VPLGGEDPCPPQPLTLADTLAAVWADVQAQPASARPFLRYVSLAQFRRGSCAGNTEPDEIWRELERARMAVSKVANLASREPRAVVPQAVGPESLLLRLDLRDYGWQRPLTLDGRGYDDAWQALVARSPIALELQGGSAGALSSELGTRAPLLLAGSFVAAATRPELYYALLRLPATLAELKRELGITPEQDVDRGPWARGAFSTSGVSKEPRGVAGYRGLALTGGYFWQTFDYGPSARTEALYLDPLATQADGHEVIFSLPNGLPAYFASDGAGARLAEPRFVIDPAQNNGRMRVSSSCSGCHNGGLITFTDAARSFVEDSSDLFSEATLTRVRESFLSSNEMQALLDASSLLMVEAAERAGQPKGTPDPVSRTALDYERELSFDRAAAELFLDRRSLIERLASLPESIAAAPTSGVLERSVFEEVYLQAACALYGTAESSPVGCP